MTEERVWFTDGAGRKVSGLLVRPDEPTTAVAVLCHGFASSKDSSTNRALTHDLVARGLAVFRFDFFGHGESEGAFADLTLTAAIHDLEQALMVVRSRGFVSIGLVGSSFGGIVSTIVAARESNNSGLHVLALKCPVSDYAALWRARLGEPGLAAWKTTGAYADEYENQALHLRYAFYADLLRYDAYVAAKMITAPTLIIHGDADEYVPIAQSHRLFSVLTSEKRLEILPGADHGFSAATDFRIMIRLMRDWLAARVTVSRPGRHPNEHGQED